MMGKLWMMLVLVCALAACSEKPQVVAKKGDAPAWQGVANGYAAEGWKAGDRSSWEAQMKARAGGQDEYARTQGAN